MNIPKLLRPHHGLCIPRFIGKGYDEKFVSEMKNFTSFLKTHPDNHVKLVCSSDVLCDSCIHSGSKECVIGSVLSLDKKCLNICNIAEGTVLPWSKYVLIINEKVSKIDSFCEDCRWVYICKDIHIKL